MSKITVQRKSNLKKNLDRDLSIGGGDRLSDDGINQRRPCYQLFQREKQRKCLPINNIRKDQLDILREILFNQRDINELIKKPNRSDKIISKNTSMHNEKNHLTNRPKLTSTKNIHSSDTIDLNQSDEDNPSIHSDDEELIENEPIRVGRSIRKDNQAYPIIRSSSLYSQSRQQINNNTRSTNSVSFMSDRLKTNGQSNTTESNINTSSDKLKKILDRLSLELNDLESMTGFKSNINVLSSHTCSTALATALITLTDNPSIHSDDEELIENEPIRVGRSIRKDNQAYPIIRSSSLYSQSRQQINNTRSTNSVSFMSDRLKTNGQSNTTESNINTSSDKLKKILDRLSLELNDLESMTGFKSNTNVLSSHTCSTALATALITLTGHIKQCASNFKEIQNINHFKDQLSIVIKSQLDFQKKIENQMITLQTMMQTICQLVNNEIISNKKYEEKFSLKKIHQDETHIDGIESHQNWLNNAQRQYLIPKDINNAMNELLMLTRRINGATPIDTDLYHQHTNNSSINRHSGYMETLDASKRLTRSTSSILANETNANEFSKQMQQHKNIDQESRSSMISPIDAPLSYDMFESGLSNGNLSASRLRNGGLDGTSTSVPSASINETILEKILRERLRLVQQMAELNKQHEMTQEELANLEAKSLQSQTIEIKK
ncbi:unnamed protein product [Rotaria sp. Silwood1]|nr:unnamed protein product [Rotaria sp. Silwood1]